ncbi:hypothetical protein ACI7RC_18795 [Brevibacillus sp. B_LB10_24]|uniref:hypothetical protein n=1 Tax=Brevibacillus sp. B_LB10_24 TaxID=3380645 RepID=UPI0038BC20E8
MSAKGKAILLVEDDAKIRGLIKLYLQKEGYDVYEAQDGEGGLSAFRTYDPCTRNRSGLPVWSNSFINEAYGRQNGSPMRNR